MGLNRLLGDLAHNLDSAAVGSYQGKSSFGTIAYSSLSGTPSVVFDSSLSSQFVDSAYIQARQLPGSSGLDSASAISVVDSDYINLRIGGGGSGFFVYEFETTAGQTAIQDSDLNGNLMAYEENGILVFKNGVLLLDSDDYTATDGSVVTLTSAAAAGSNITISKYVLGGGGGSSFAWGGARAVRMGGDVNSGKVNQIQYWNMASASDAADFGDLQAAKSEGTGLSNATRGICARGNARTDEIDYITIATLGNATDFGNCLAGSTQNGVNGACDGTTGLWAGQDPSSGGYTNVIERITVATPGNATDHGDLTSTRIYVPMTNDASRYLTMGGYGAGGANQINNIEYGTFVAGNSTDFGDLINIGYNGGTASDTTRGIKAGGYVGSNQNVIEYVTIQTPGNGTDFGDLTAGANGLGGHSDGTNAQFAGGWSYAVHIDTMVVQTPGNATDHGDLATGTASSACCSGNAA
jgi:hypothetical protein